MIVTIRKRVVQFLELLGIKKIQLIHFLGFIGFEQYKQPPYGYGAQPIDRKLQKYLNFRNGFFIELGANNGLHQSNTYYLERYKKWNGILIEPIPERYQEIPQWRKRAQTFNCACVAFDYPLSEVEMTFADLMSVVKGGMHSESEEKKHLEDAVRVINDVHLYEFKVPARTLTSILDECQVQEIDFLSLDVEGYEANVLRGLNFEKYAPRYMLIEARYREEVEAVINHKYEFVEQITPMDILYRLKKV